MTDKRKLGFDSSPFTDLDDPNLKLSDAAREYYARRDTESSEEEKEPNNG